MINWNLSRDEAEFLWDLLMEKEPQPIRSTKEDLAREIAKLCGFDHDKAVDGRR